MSVESILNRGRRRRKALMRSRCTITRTVGDQVFNPATGLYDAVVTETVYEGVCELQHAYAPSDEASQVGEAGTVQSRNYELVLPFDSPEIEYTDLVVVTASDNQWVVGVPLRVAKTGYGSNRTAQHVALVAQDVRGGDYGGYTT